MTLKGKKTIATAVFGVAAAWVSYALGAEFNGVYTLTLADALNATWVGFMAIFMRLGINNAVDSTLVDSDEAD